MPLSAGCGAEVAAARAAGGRGAASASAPIAPASTGDGGGCTSRRRGPGGPVHAEPAQGSLRASIFVEPPDDTGCGALVTHFVAIRRPGEQVRPERWARDGGATGRLRVRASGSAPWVEHARVRLGRRRNARRRAGAGGAACTRGRPRCERPGRLGSCAAARHRRRGGAGGTGDRRGHRRRRSQRVSAVQTIAKGPRARAIAKAPRARPSAGPGAARRTRPREDPARESPRPPARRPGLARIVHGVSRGRRRRGGPRRRRGAGVLRDPSASSAASRASSSARSSSSASPAACAARRSHTIASTRSWRFQRASAVCSAQTTSSASVSIAVGMKRMPSGIRITRRALSAAWTQRTVRGRLIPRGERLEPSRHRSR